MSRYVRRNLKPPLETGNGLTMSIATRSEGTVTISLAYIVMGLGLDLFFFWHTKQLFICLMESAVMEGQ